MASKSKAQLADVGRAVWRSRVVLVVNLTDNNTLAVQRIRAQLSKHDIRMRFLKNSIANVALRDFPKVMRRVHSRCHKPDAAHRVQRPRAELSTPSLLQRAKLGNLLRGQTAIIYSDHDTPLPAFKAIQVRRVGSGP